NYLSASRAATIPAVLPAIDCRGSAISTVGSGPERRYQKLFPTCQEKLMNRHQVVSLFARAVSRALVVRIAAVVAAFSIATAAHAQVIFDSTDSPLPGNIPSLGYQATQTAEFGNEITLAGANHQIGNVKIIMSDWANQADYPGVGDATGW